MHGSIKFPIQWNQNVKVTPTQNFDEIWFWITDFTASVLWVKAITHMHNIIYDSYIMNSRFSDEVCYNYDLEKIQLWLLSSMSHYIWRKMTLFKFDLSQMVWVTKYGSTMMFFLNRNYDIFNHKILNSKSMIHVSHCFDS